MMSSYGQDADEYAGHQKPSKMDYIEPQELSSTETKTGIRGNRITLSFLVSCTIPFYS